MSPGLASAQLTDGHPAIFLTRHLPNTHRRSPGHILDPPPPNSQKVSRRCVPYSSKTHVYDFAKRPWLYPSLIKFLPRLQDVADRMRQTDPRRRPSFTQVMP